MFAKKFKFGKEFLLSSKDKKNFQAKLKANIVSKQFQYKQISISGTKIKIYSEESESWIPIFIESEFFFPTIFFLWKVPDYLPTVYIWSPVSKFIVNGADLMWPGVANIDQIKGNLKTNTIVSVSVVGNVPIAVGILVSDGPENNNKGKCVKILHHYRDELWMMFQSIPNEGFLINKVVPVHLDLVENEVNEKLINEVGQSKDLVEKKVNQGSLVNTDIENFPILGGISELNCLENKSKEHGLEQKDDNKKGVNDSLDVEEKGKELSQMEKIEEIKEGLLEKNEKIDEFKTENFKNEEIKQELDREKEENDDLEEGKENGEEFVEEDKEVDGKILNLSADEVIMEIFLTTLLVAVKPEDFPLEPSTLQKLMHACKRSYTLDFSQSSYKKIGKFLDHAKKIELIEYDKPKRSDHKLIISVNSQHPMLQNFVPIVNKPKTASKEVEDSPSKYPKVIFSSCFIPKFEYTEIFSVIVPDRSNRAFQKSEVNSLLTKYLTIKGLESTKATIKTDQVLQKALKCKEIMPKSEIFIKFRDLFEEGYKVQYTSGLLSEMVYFGPVPQINITVSKGRNKHKKLTTVKGFDSYYIDMDELHEIAQKTFSAAASITKEETKAKTSYCLQVLGNHAEKFPALFDEYFKVPKSNICVTIL